MRLRKNKYKIFTMGLTIPCHVKRRSKIRLLYLQQLDPGKPML